MAEVRQVPLEEYENMKKSYGLTDEQMRSVMNVEPLKTRWADGYGESRKKDEQISVKDRHQQLVNEIRSRLENGQVEVKPEVKETVENPVQNEVKVDDTPAFSEPETKVEEVPSFAMPQEEVVSTPTDNTGIALSDDISKSRDEMFEMGKNKLLELLKMDNQLSKSTDFSR